MFGQAVPLRSAPLLRSLLRKVHRRMVPCQTKITSRNHGVSSKLATKPMFHALKQDHLGSRIGDLQKWCLFQVEINVWHVHAAVFHLILVAGRLRRAQTCSWQHVCSHVSAKIAERIGASEALCIEKERWLSKCCVFVTCLACLSMS